MKVAVIGGGPAGMMAAISASKKGNEVYLIEKNGRIEETAGVRGDSHGQAARRTSLFPHSSRTD